jgi:hypothetical protein
LARSSLACPTPTAPKSSTQTSTMSGTLIRRDLRTRLPAPPVAATVNRPRQLMTNTLVSPPSAAPPIRRRYSLAADFLRYQIDHDHRPNAQLSRRPRPKTRR